MGKRILEIGGILIILLSLLIFLSLYTYSPLDPSLNSSGISPEFPIQNRVGAVGGYVSDFLLQAIGYSSFLLPLIGILIGARFILHLKISNFLFRLIGFIFILLTISTMIRIIRPDLRYENLLGGGVFGEKAGAFLLAKFGIQGGLLICAALILISSLLMLQLFLIEMVKRAWLALTGRFNDLSSAMGSKYRKKVQEHEREQLRREMLEKHRAHREATPTSIPVESSSSEPSESELPARNAPPITKGGIGPRRAIQEELPFPELRKISGFKLPPLTLLDNPPKGNAIDEKEIQAKARLIESKFAEFGIEALSVPCIPVL